MKAAVLHQPNQPLTIEDVAVENECRGFEIGELHVRGGHAPALQKIGR